MAHNLNFNEKANQYAFASAVEIPWHKLGQIVDHKMTTREAIEFAHLNYHVEKTPALVQLNDEILTIPNSFATFRTDNNAILTKSGKTVTKDYKVVQNIEAFEFFDAIIDEGEAIIETAGALGDGEIVFITAKLPESYITPDDVVNNYLVLTMSHDGTMSIQSMFSPVRVVCNNTLSAALDKNSHKITIRHTLSASDRLKMAHNLMGITKKNIENINIVHQAMANTKINKEQMKYFLDVFLTHDEIMELENKRLSDVISSRKMNLINGLIEYLHIGVGQDMDTTKGTVWGAYNAITGYYHNIKNYKDDTSKVISLIKGDYGNKINTAFKKAIELI